MAQPPGAYGSAYGAPPAGYGAPVPQAAWGGGQPYGYPPQAGGGYGAPPGGYYGQGAPPMGAYGANGGGGGGAFPPGLPAPGPPVPQVHEDPAEVFERRGGDTYNLHNKILTNITYAADLFFFFFFFFRCVIFARHFLPGSTDHAPTPPFSPPSLSFRPSSRE